MAKRNFVKAYNDIIAGTTSPSPAGVLNGFTKLSRQGPRKVARVEKVIRKVPSLKLARKQSSRNLNKQKPIPPVENVSGLAGWTHMKRTDCEQFLDIDADNVVNNEPKCPVHSHKVSQRAKIVSATRSPSSPLRPIPDRAEKNEITKDDSRGKSLPKGVTNPDQPYVTPKFTPNFREMAMSKEKTEPLVSIMESTPPSMQKWAIEWNAEPKNMISIAELKDDIRREQTGSVSSAQTSGLYSEENWTAVGSSPPLKLQNTAEARRSSKNASTQNHKRYQPALLNRIQTDSQRPQENNQTSSFWSHGQAEQGNSERSKIISRGWSQMKYSFKKSIQSGIPEKANRRVDSHPEAEKSMIYQSLRQRYARKVDESHPSEVNYANQSTNDSFERSKQSYSVGTSQAATASTIDERRDSRKHERDETKNDEKPEESAAPEVPQGVTEDSSFYDWLKLRGLPMVRSDEKKQCTNTSKHPAEGSVVPKNTIYSRVNAKTKQFAERETTKNKSEKLSRESNSSVRATKSQMSFKRSTGTRKRAKSQEPTKLNVTDAKSEAFGQVGGGGSQGRGAYNEADYVENMRWSEDVPVPVGERFDDDNTKYETYKISRGRNGQFSLIEKDCTKTFASNQSTVKRQISSKQTNKRVPRSTGSGYNLFADHTNPGSSKTKDPRGKSMYNDIPIPGLEPDEPPNHTDTMDEYDDCWMKSGKGIVSAFDSVSNEEDQGWVETIGPKYSMMTQ